MPKHPDILTASHRPFARRARIRHRTAFRLLAGVLLCTSLAPALARSPAYARGDAAYQRGDFSLSAREFRQATRDDPNDTVAFWKLGLALRKTGDHSGAIRAWDQARTLDPDRSFASSPEKFDELYAGTAKKARTAGSAAGTAVGSPPGPNGSTQAGKKGIAAGPVVSPDVGNPAADPLLKELTSKNAYVAETIPKQVADEARLEHLADGYSPVTVRVAVVEGFPVTNDDNRAAEFVHGYLGMNRDVMILVTRHGGAFGRGGVSVFTQALDRQKLLEIQKASPSHFTNGLEEGIRFVADRAVSDLGASGRSQRTLLLVVVLAALGGVAALIYFQQASTKRRITGLNRDLSYRLTALQDEFCKFDLEAGTVSDTPLLQEAKQLRLAAVDPFAAAGEAFQGASSLDNYLDTDRITVRAEKLAARARVRLDQALGRRTLDELSLPRQEDVPEEERGACFFCSRPARLDSLRPLPVRIDDRTRRVLACEDCAEVAKTGRQPQLLAVPEEDGRRVPWYQSQRYDPWSDYGRGGFAGGGIGLMDYLVLENLFDENRRARPTVIETSDAGYADHIARDAGGAGFSDPTRLEPERGEGDFFGTGDTDRGAPSGGESTAGDFFDSDQS